MPLENEIKINEAYRDYTPPFDVPATIRRLLRTVPKEYLKGLDCIVLTNELALSRSDRAGKVWSRGRKFKKSRVFGRYHYRSRSSLPYVEIRVDKILRSLQYVPFPFGRATLLRDIVFGHILFHELGHHIHRTIRPEHTEKEDVADKWAGKLNANFVCKTYWYGPFVIKIYRFLSRIRRIEKGAQ